MREFTCRDCGEIGVVYHVKGPVPVRCESCKKIIKRSRDNSSRKGRFRVITERDRARSADTLINRIKTLKRFYNITLDQYDSILESQGGGCALCGVTSEKNGWSLSVDHDHSCCDGRISCGKCVRGVLCNKCNLSLRRMVKTPEMLMYLSKPRPLDNGTPVS